MNKSVKRYTVIIFTVILMTMVAGAAAWAQGGTDRVLVLPFKMNAPQETSYLQQGILDMLVSRLEWPERVNVVSKSDAWNAYKKAGGNLDEAKARELGRSLNVDYVLFGSVTMVGQSVSLDSTMLDLKGAKQPIKVYTQSEGLDGVIPKVNEFANEINAKFFGRGSQTTYQAQTGPATGEPTPAYRRHPDYLLTGPEGQKMMSPLNPNFIMAVGGDEREGAFWRSPTLKLEISGMSVADVDGDGKNEIIYTSKNALFVVRLENGVLTPVGNYQGFASDNYLTMDVADVNGNGVPEIFISIQRAVQAASLVLEFRGGKLTPIVVDSPYYFRIVSDPSGKILAGQKGGVLDRFYGGVFRMGFSGGQYVPEQPLVLPKKANLFNFALVNFSDQGILHVPMINDSEKLVIETLGGDELWTSKEEFCSRSTYMEERHSSIMSDKESRDDGLLRYYVPTRILVTDLDENGEKEILVAGNESTVTSSLFTKWRSFKRGALQSLSFKNMSLRQNWRSRELPGALTDYLVADYNNDGRRDLVVAVVMRASSGVEEARSAIVAYELASPEEMRQTEQAREQQ